MMQECLENLPTTPHRRHLPVPGTLRADARRKGEALQTVGIEAWSLDRPLPLSLDLKAGHRIRMEALALI